MRKFVLLILAVLMTGALFAQNRQVSGTVTNESGEPVIGAAVSVQGTNAVAVTGADGEYSISAPADATLVAKIIGMDDVSVAIGNRSVVDIVMSTDAEMIDDVVVVAFGTKRKQDLVGSVSTVKQDVIQNSQAASVSSALEGAVAGLQVISSTGQPGQDASIYIRGIGSLSASNAALIVVDGVPFNGKLSDLNPADIASMTVSKDAVSNSLYGSRAANGVVMVQTKTGKKDKTTVQFQGSWGVASRAYKDYDMVTDPGEFYELTWFGMRNTQMVNGKGLSEANQFATDNLLSELGNYNAFIVPQGEPLVGTDGKLNSNAKKRYDDKFADAMFDSAFRQEYVASASGGNDRTDFYVSMGYLDNDSYIIGSSYNRFTGRANVNAQLKKWLKVGSNIAYSKTNQYGVQSSATAASNPFIVARSWAPIFPVHAYDAQGNLVLDDSGKPVYDAGNGQTAGTTTRPNTADQNVIVNLKEDIRENTYHNLSSRSYFEITFLKDFTFTTNYSYDYTNSYYTQYVTPTVGDGLAYGGRGTKETWNDMTSNLSEILAWDRQFGKHNVAAKAGHEFYEYKGNYFDGQKTNFFDPTNPELNNGGPMAYIGSYNLNHNIEGYFAMVDYNYDNKYYFSGAFRRDGTSRFLNRWGNFGSVGAAWRISAEKWLDGADRWLNDLKLRASWGTQGQENILTGYAYAYTPYQDQYSISWDGTSLGYVTTFFGNPDLTWEKQATFDVGLDFRLWDRFYGAIDYFVRTTDDMLFRKTLATSAGRNYNWENVGAMRNSGIEIDLNVDVIRKTDFRWTVSLVGSSYKNEITRLPEENREAGITTGNFKYMEGKSRYEFFTWEYAGMDENGNAQWYKETENEDGTVTREITKEYTNATRRYVGKSALPDFNGGLNMSFYYKGIDLSLATAFQFGGWGWDDTYFSGMGMTYDSGKSRDMWDTYNPETGEGKYPVWNRSGLTNSYLQTSDVYLIDASYFSIRNLTIGYNFPKKWMDKLGIQNVRVFVSAENLAMWSKRQGYDPRISMSGSNEDFAGYSPMKIISGGVNLSF